MPQQSSPFALPRESPPARRDRVELGSNGPNPVFLQEACARLTHDLQQALDRERWLFGRVEALERECMRLAGEHAELLATVDELTHVALRGGEAPVAGPPVARAPAVMPMVAQAPAAMPMVAQAQPLRMVPPPVTRVRPAAPRPTAPRLPRMSRRWSWHADWDDPPDDRDEELARELGGPWYSRPSAIILFAAAAAAAFYAVVW